MTQIAVIDRLPFQLSSKILVGTNITARTNMALTECGECGWSVSTGAKSCPRCGFEPDGGFVEIEQTQQSEDLGWGEVDDWGAEHHSTMTVKRWAVLFVAVVAVGWWIVAALMGTDKDDSPPRQQVVDVELEQAQPNREAGPDRPSQGEVGYVWSGHKTVPVGISEDAYSALVDAISSNDEYGIAELLGAEIVFLVEDNTKIRMLEPSLFGASRIRVIEGPYEGHAGYLSDQMTFLKPQ